MRYSILCLFAFAGFAQATHFTAGVVAHPAFVQTYAAPVVQRVEIPTCQVAPVVASGYAFGHVAGFSQAVVIRQAFRQRVFRRAVIIQPVRRVFRHR